MKVLIIGKNGQLANELVTETPQGIEVIALGRSDTDIRSLDELNNVVKDLQPEVIINASAYTAVDKAESEVDAAYAINHLAVDNLAKIAKTIDARFLHVSTDFVFDGESNQAYLPQSKTNPSSVYGASKLAGELAIKKGYPENSAIIRTSWVYSSFGNNFVKTMLRLIKEKDELGVVCDQIGCPTHAKGLARFLWKLVFVEQLESIYHWSDKGLASWYDFAIAIQDIALEQGLLERKKLINPILSSAYPTAARRPKFSLLNSNRSYLISETNHWTHQLEECIQQLAKDVE